MIWVHYLSWFCGGIFLANSIPHFVRGISGLPFQTPFASPPGKGLSSSTVNVLWGFFNVAVAWLLILRVGHFDLQGPKHAAALGLGILLTAVAMAQGFGRLHGGNITRAQGAARK